MSSWEGIIDRHIEIIDEETRGCVDIEKKISPIGVKSSVCSSEENSFANRVFGIEFHSVRSSGEGTIPYLTSVMQGFISFRCSWWMKS